LNLSLLQVLPKQLNSEASLPKISTLGNSHLALYLQKFPDHLASSHLRKFVLNGSSAFLFFIFSLGLILLEK